MMIVYFSLILSACSHQPIDKILVKKSEKSMHLMKEGKIVKSYFVSLGFAPQGHKVCEGDGRTPEGCYYIETRNEKSRYHKSLKISYPNAQDVAYAQERGLDPGGDIMIHGMEKKFNYLGKSHVTELWTRGCVVVTNQEIEEIWDLVQDGTPVEIQP